MENPIQTQLSLIVCRAWADAISKFIFVLRVAATVKMMSITQKIKTFINVTTMMMMIMSNRLHRITQRVSSDTYN
jgi:hypothetical protein